MEPYKEMYYHLFNAVTDALAMLARQNYGLAAKRLKRAQRETKEWYLEADEPEENAT